MQNPFGTQAQQSVAPALKEDKALGSSAAQLIVAKKAKDSGDATAHANALVNFNYALKQQKLDDDKARLQQAQKHDQEIRKLTAQLTTAEDASALTDLYLDKIKSGDKDTALAILAIMKDSNPQIAAMLEAKGNPLHEAAQHGVVASVQDNIYHDQNQEALNAETPDEIIRRKETTGQVLTPIEEAQIANRAGINVDENAAARVQLGIMAEANTIGQDKQQPQDIPDNPNLSLIHI